MSQHIFKRAVIVLVLLPVSAAIFYVAAFKSYLLVSTDFDTYIGEKVTEKILSKYSQCSNEKFAHTLNRIKDIIQPEKSNIRYTVYVLNHPDVNAFALPNGNIFFFTGLTEITSNPNELAGVLAHEMSHVEKRHGIQQLIRMMGVSFFISVTIGAGFEEIETAETIAEIANIFIYSRYSQGFEREADMDAIKFLHDKNISAKGIVSFFDKINRKDGSSSIIKWLSTHPDTADRIRYIKKNIGSEQHLKEDPLYKYRNYWHLHNKCYK